jgi:hypothetical protein
VDIYNVDLATARIPRGKRFRRFLAMFAIFGPVYFAIEFAFEWLWPVHRGRDRTFGMAIQAVLWGFAMSITFSFRKGAHYQIIVDEDEISTKNFKSMNRLSSRTIPRSQVRTLIEKRNGLMISRHNRVGAFFWGGIWIPKQLADYEYLKRLVSSWKVAKFN